MSETSQTTSASRFCRSGAVVIVVMIYLVLFASLAVAFTAATNMGLQQAKNCRDAHVAQLAAESGMAYAVKLLRDCRSDPTLEDLPDMMTVVKDHFESSIAGVTCDLVEDAPDVPGGRYVVSSPIALPDAGAFRLKVYVSSLDAEDGVTPTALQIVSTGHAGASRRSCGMTFSVDIDKQLLHYAMVSSVRIVARGNIRIHGPICSGWGRQLMPGARNKHVPPLNIRLGRDGFVDGAIATTLSQNDYRGNPALGDSDFHDILNHEDPLVNLEEQIEYDHPPVMQLDSEDFDTAPLRAMAVNALPSPDTGSTFRDHGTAVDRPALENVFVPRGTNPVFENCTFRGITYIEVDEQTDNPSSNNQNRVVFRNCTFEGPIITGVPKTMNWNHNRMDFEGDTEFRSTMIQEALGGVTLMAPNYNVNIGDCVDRTGGDLDSDSEIRGLVIGGVVDLRDKVRVRGTVVSMAQLWDEDGNIIMGQGKSWLTGTGVCDANLGYLSGGSEGGGDESNNDIDIIPDPDNVIPLGIKKRYLMVLNPDSYVEFVG